MSTFVTGSTVIPACFRRNPGGYSIVVRLSSGGTNVAVPPNQLFQEIGFLLQKFLVSGREHRDNLLFLNSLLVEPLRLFHPTVLHCVKCSVIFKSSMFLALNSHSC